MRRGDALGLRALAPVSTTRSARQTGKTKLAPWMSLAPRAGSKSPMGESAQCPSFQKRTMSAVRIDAVSVQLHGLIEGRADAGSKMRVRL